MAIVHTATFLSSSLDSNTCKMPPEYSLHSLFSNPLSEGGPELVVFLSWNNPAVAFELLKTTVVSNCHCANADND